MANQPPRRRVASFRTQRVIATFSVYGLTFFFTTAVLWQHIDSIITAGTYALLAKAGLLILPAVALIMTIWELFVDDVGARRRFKPHPTVVRLVNWCFWSAFILMACEIIHDGALLKLESSTRQQASTIKTVGEAQAGIAAATTKAAIESSGKVAKDFNAAGQRRSAQRTIASGKDVATSANAIAQQQLAAAAAQGAPATFLPSWYVAGGMYVALPLLACIAFVITMAFARAANPYVDRDDDGRPDATQGRAEAVNEDWPEEIEEADPQSARIEMKPTAATFTDAPKGSVRPAETEPLEGSAKGSVKGSVEGSGSGYELPQLQNLQWELNAKGGWEAWHTPDGAQPRRDRTYLGYLGKRQLAAWEQSKTPAEFREAVGAWVEQKRAAKL